MFEKFSESARRALFFARYQAGFRDRQSLGSEDILLGILKQNDRAAMELLARLNVSAEAIEGKYPAVRSEVPYTGEMPLTQNAMQVLAHAVEEAELRKHEEVEPRHLLLGILRVPTSRGARALGVTYDEAAAALE